jgi:hypothetical protein
MPTADVVGFDGLERDLVLALATDPSPASATRMDGRVAAASAALAASTAPAAPRAELWPRRHLRLVLLVAAALALMGASVALSLLQQAAELMPGWRVAYDQAEILNLSQTASGYTVTLERGYLDPNQLVLGFVVTGPKGQTRAVPRGTVTDAQGRSFLEIAGGDIQAEVQNSAATISSYQVPPGVGGGVTLTATFAELMPVTVENIAAPTGPWVFHFTLPVHPATVVEPMQTVEAAGVPITLHRMQATATTVRVQLDLDLAQVRTAQWSRWSMEGSLRHGHGPAQDLTWVALPPEWTGQPKDQIQAMIEESETGSVVMRQTFAGASEPAGTWTLTVDRLIGSDGQGGTTEVPGPWAFTVQVP